MEPSLDIWSLLFLIAASQGVFLSILLFARRSSVNSLLGWLILSFSICMGYYVSFWSGYSKIWPWQLGVLQGLTFSFGPLTYFYLHSNKKETYFDAKHLIPFLLYSIYFLLDKPPRFLHGGIIAFVQVTHLLCYSALIWFSIKKGNGDRNGAQKRYYWQRKIAIAFAGYAVSFLTYYLLVWMNLIQIQYDYMISVWSAGFIYFIGYTGFTKSEVLRMNEASRYGKSSLSSTAAHAILAKLKALMESEKPYLQPSLKLQDVAETLEFKSHHISQAINEVEEKNFSDFVNGYRISTAMGLLTSTNQKMIHIAFDSGFSNKASFNNAFKKATGMSPSEYRATR